MVLVIPHTFKEHVTSRAVYFDFSSAIRILNFSFVRFDLAYLGKEFGHLWFGYRVLNIKGQSRVFAETFRGYPGILPAHAMLGSLLFHVCLGRNQYFCYRGKCDIEMMVD